MKSDRFWIITVAAVFALSFALAAIVNITSTRGGTAEIYRAGKLVHTVDLTSIGGSYTITLEYDGEINIIEIERGRIRILSANCPDGSCVRQGWLSSGAAPVVCLPHRVVIIITGGAPDGADAVAG